MLSKVIGIISYFPDDIRDDRRNRLRHLLEQLNAYMNLPVIIVAQNWAVEDVKKLFDGLHMDATIHTNQRLGITKARMLLREKFLETDYDYLIMFDDDMEIKEDKSICDAWLSEIDGKDFYWTQTFLTNFCAISREAMSKVNYDEDADSTKGTGFEDWIFTERCIYTLNSQPFKTYLPSRTRQGFLNDSLSTWDPHNPVLKRINEINSLKKIIPIREGKCV